MCWSPLKNKNNNEVTYLYKKGNNNYKRRS